MNIENKVIWITGVTSGIGLALVKILAKYPKIKLVLSARKISSLEKVISDNNIQCPHLLLPLDLEQPNHFNALAEKVVQTFGCIDILINNAGISQRSFAKDTSLEVDRKIISVDYIGVVALTKAVLPHFIKQQSGYFVTISSLMGKFSAPYRTSYAGAKHALHGFFDALRLEHFHDHIKVLLICPGFVQTNISYNALGGSGEIHGKVDNTIANGLTAEDCALRIIKAIEKDKNEVVITKTLKEKMGVYLKFLAPRLLDKIILKSEVI